MRLYEFTHEDGTFEKYIILLRNLIGRAKSKGTPAKYNWAALNGMAKSIGVKIASDYESFKLMYDSSPPIQNLVKNFNSSGIQLNVPGVKDGDEPEVGKSDAGGDTIDKMASRQAAKSLKQ